MKSILFASSALAAQTIISNVVISENQISGTNGVRFNQPTPQGSGAVADNLNEFVGGKTAGLYAFFEQLQPTNPNQMVVLDAAIGDFVSCPAGYESAGQINPNVKKQCKWFGLCLKRVKATDVQQDDTIVSSLTISKWEGGKDKYQPDTLRWFMDGKNMQDGCGSQFGYSLVVQRDAAFPTDHLNWNSGEEKVALLKKYAPNFTFHTDEKYWPSSVSYILDGSTRVYQDGRWHLNSKASKPTLFKEDAYFRGQSNLDKVPVYSFYLTKDAGVVDLIWTGGYPYNKGKSIAIALGTVFGNHIGDWEHAGIRFINGAPAVLYTQYHSYGNYVYYKSPLYTREGNRPKLYVAKGSHGIWTAAGTFQYLDAALGLVKASDETNNGPVWDPTKSMEAFEYNHGYQAALPGNKEFTSWPQWLQDGADNANLGNSDSRSGPIREWGQIDKDGCIAGQCQMEAGPSGPRNKPYFYSNQMNS